eukprot:scaffold399565_cov19-Prasinocladus_malaysianus.AAC.1
MAWLTAASPQVKYEAMSKSAAHSHCAHRDDHVEMLLCCTVGLNLKEVNLKDVMWGCNMASQSFQQLKLCLFVRKCGAFLHYLSIHGND